MTNKSHLSLNKIYILGISIYLLFGNVPTISRKIGFIFEITLGEDEDVIKQSHFIRFMEAVGALTKPKA